MDQKQKRNFWFMSIVNVFFFLLMIFAAGAHALTCLVFVVIIQALLIGYYTFINRYEKRSKTREWVDAIAFAVVAATLIRNFFIEAYTIPTPSMEKSLLIGDFLFVSKVNYGARTPMTPVSFPFAHNTMPVTGGNSYLEAFTMPYYRLPGFQKIKNLDVVVFNYPCSYEDEDGRPVDKKENYIKRCIAIPGDDIQLVRGEVFLNGKHIPFPDKGMYRFEVHTDGSRIPLRLFRELGMRPPREIEREEDFQVSLQEDDATQVGEKMYYMFLSRENYNRMKTQPGVVKIDTLLMEQDQVEHMGQRTFPHDPRLMWNREYYGPLHVPAAGETITLDSSNYYRYERAIRIYENHPTFKMEGGKFFMDGKPIDSYTFKYNY
jgi:signal peptidase I